MNFSPAGPMEIVRISRRHLPQIARIETSCFSLPWSEKSLEIFFTDGAVCLAALDGDRVAAYVGMITVLDEGQIINLATDAEYRRRGIGEALMVAVEEYAKGAKVRRLSLEVRESNGAARALYGKLGWSEAGVRKNFYSHPVENGIVMTKDLNV